MKKITVVFETATYALKAKKIMMRLGGEVSLIKLTSKGLGCTHAIEINERDLYMLISELKSRNIIYRVLSE